MKKRRWLKQRDVQNVAQKWRRFAKAEYVFTDAIIVDRDLEMGRTKTIKLSVDEYNNLKLAREKLIEYGLISLPKPLRLELSDFLKDEKLTLGKMVGVVAHTLSYVLTLTNKKG